MEISRLAQADPQANRLLDEFFNACFAAVAAPVWAPVQVAPAPDPARIAGTLGALNAWLRSQDPDSEGLVPPNGMPLEEWAEDIALQFLSNSPC